MDIGKPLRVIEAPAPVSVPAPKETPAEPVEAEPAREREKVGV